MELSFCDWAVPVLSERQLPATCDWEVLGGSSCDLAMAFSAVLHVSLNSHTWPCYPLGQHSLRVREHNVTGSPASVLTRQSAPRQSCPLQKAKAPLIYTAACGLAAATCLTSSLLAPSPRDL